MILDDIALTLHPTVGCKTAIHLIERFGGASDLFAASQEELVERGELKASVARSIVRHEYHAAAEKELEFITRNRIRALAATDPAYPQRLLECPDYPHVLYVKGEIDLNCDHALAIVGTRKVTPYGVKMCEILVADLAPQFPDLIIVSGLAYGADIAAHRAAMQCGVHTVAVLGHPLTHIYPSAHTESARRIVQQGGALISEFPSTAKPDKSGFVLRNRLIAGITDGTVIVESAVKGGSLITAEMADGYHRTVMAVPGRAGERYAEGTNGLIRTLKAQMVCGGKDIVEALNWDLSEPQTASAALQRELRLVQAAAAEGCVPAPTYADEEFPFEKEPAATDPDADPGSAQTTEGDTPIEGCAEDEEGAQREMRKQAERSVAVQTVAGRQAQLLSLLCDEPITLDELSLRSGIALGEIPALLLELELANRIRALPGNRYLKYR